MAWHIWIVVVKFVIASVHGMGDYINFVLHSASQNLYPTPVIRYMSRCPAPSGHEEKLS